MLILYSGNTFAGELPSRDGSGSKSNPAQDKKAETAMGRHLTKSDTLSTLLNHPAFRGFSQYILPQGRYRNEEMPLGNIATLLPYHSHVNAENALVCINKMIDLISKGDKIFHDIGRSGAGLFFFKGKPGAPFAIICPGGGFSYVGSIHEGFPHALALSAKGYHAFVIHYRTGNAFAACEDLAAGIEYIFRHKDELQLDTGGYSIWGSSAGARMAAYLGSHGTKAFGAADLPRPATVVMAYTGHREYTTMNPPTYAVVGSRDFIADPELMHGRVKALQASGIKAEFHLFPALQHGFGLGTGTSAEGWIDDAVRFWEENRTR